MDNNIIIEMPQQIQNDYDSFVFLINFHNKVKKINNSIVILEFNKTRWIEANLTAILGAIFNQIFNNNNKLKVSRMSNSIKSVLLKNDFLKYFGLSDNVDDKYESTIKYTQFKNTDRIKFQQYLKGEFMPKIRLTMTEMFQKELRTNLDEIFQNARIHGKCNNIYVCGQVYFNKKIVKFTIVDLGVTIHQNVKDKFKKEISAVDSIDWATKYGNSTKVNESGGIGLFQLREFLKANGGRIQVISSNGIWEEDGENINKYSQEESFQGTIVNIDVNIDEKIYIGKNEMDSIQEWIGNIF